MNFKLLMTLFLLLVIVGLYKSGTIHNQNSKVLASDVAGSSTMYDYASLGLKSTVYTSKPSTSTPPVMIKRVPDHSIMLDGQTAYINYQQRTLPLSLPLTIEGWFRPQYNHGAANYESAIATPILDPSGYCRAGTFDINVTQNQDPTRFNVVAAIVIDGGYVVLADILSGGYSYNQWHHLALVINSDMAYLYIDGNLAVNGLMVGSICDSTKGINSGAKVIIGQPGNFFKGEMSEIRISNSMRYTSAFIPAAFYQPDQNTLGLWHFYGNALDSSGKKNNATTSGNIQYVMPPPPNVGPNSN